MAENRTHGIHLKAEARSLQGFTKRKELFPVSGPIVTEKFVPSTTGTAVRLVQVGNGRSVLCCRRQPISLEGQEITTEPGRAPGYVMAAVTLLMLARVNTQSAGIVVVKLPLVTATVLT